MRLKIEVIICDETLQSRLEINEKMVDEYYRELTEGYEPPPIDVFDINGKYFVVDGFHRLKASVKANRCDIECTVHTGTMADARRFAAGTNRAHGLRRTNEDKKKAITMLLDDPEIAKRSDREISRLAHVSHKFVGNVRRAMESGDERQMSRWVRRGGIEYFMNTENLRRGGGRDDEPKIYFTDMDVDKHGPVDGVAISLQNKFSFEEYDKMPMKHLVGDKGWLQVTAPYRRMMEARKIVEAWGFKIQATFLAEPAPGEGRKTMRVTIIASIGLDPLGDANAIVDRLMGSVDEGLQLYQGRRQGWRSWGLFRNDSKTMS